MSEIKLTAEIKHFFLKLCESIGSLARKRKVNPLCWNSLNNIFFDKADIIRANDKKGSKNPKKLINFMIGYWKLYDERHDKFTQEQFINKLCDYIIDRYSKSGNYVSVTRDGFKNEIAYVYLDYVFTDDDVLKYRMIFNKNKYYLVLLPDRAGPQPVLRTCCSSFIFLLSADEKKYLLDLLSFGDTEKFKAFSDVVKRKPADSEYQLMRYFNNRNQRDSTIQWFEREVYIFNNPLEEGGES